MVLEDIGNRHGNAEFGFRIKEELQENEQNRFFRCNKCLFYKQIDRSEEGEEL